MNKLAVLVGILVVGIIIGAVREFMFINLNYEIDHLSRATQTSYAHSQFRYWVSGRTLQELIFIKWSAALFFIACMLVLTIIFGKTLSGDFRMLSTTVLIFTVLSLVALALHWAADFVPNLKRVAVVILHSIQYPVPLLILFFSYRLRERKSLDTKA